MSQASKAHSLDLRAWFDEARALGELGGNEAMRNVETVGHDVLATHGAIVSTIARIVAFGFLLITLAVRPAGLLGR